MPDFISCQRCGLQYRAADIHKGAACRCGQKLWRQRPPRTTAPPPRPRARRAAPAWRSVALVAAAVWAAVVPAPASAWRWLAGTIREVRPGMVYALPAGLARGLLRGDWGRHAFLRAQGDRLTGLAWGLLALVLYRVAGYRALLESPYTEATDGARGLALSAILVLLGAALGASATRATRRGDLPPQAPAAAMVGMASGLLLTFWAWAPGPLWLFSLILLPPALSWTGLLLGALAAGRARATSRLTPHLVGVVLAYMALVSGVFTLPSIPTWSFVRQARSPALIPLCQALDSYHTTSRPARMWAVLTSEDPDLIRAELPAILAPGNPEGRRLLLRLIESPDMDDKIRLAVVLELIDTPGPQSLEMVARAAHDARTEAGSRAFGALARAEDNYLAYAIALARSTDARTAAAGLLIIGQASRVADAPALLRLAHGDADPRVRALACSALGRLHDPRTSNDVVTAMMRLALRDPDPLVRAAACRTLGEFHDLRSFDVILAATKDPAQEVRDRATYALGMYKDPRRTEVLIRAVGSDRWQVDNNAVVALAGSSDVRATRAVIRYLASHPDDGNAIYVLSDPDATELPELINALKSPHPAVRRGVVEALSTSDDPRAWAAINAHEDPANDAYRKQQLQEMKAGRDHYRYWEALLTATRFGGPDLRAYALTKMREFCKQEGDSYLGSSLRDKSVRVRRAIADLLDDGEPDHAREFGMMLNDDDEGLRLRAIRTLVKLKAVSESYRLAGALGMDKSPKVRKAAAEALGALHATQQEAALREAAQDDDNPAVRAAAAHALKKIK